MAPLADEINAAASDAGLDRRQNDGIALTNVQVRHTPKPATIRYKWSSHRRSPDKFTTWLRNVRTNDFYRANPSVNTSDGRDKIDLSSLGNRPGKYQLVLTEYSNVNNVYARSYTFNIHNSDF